MTSTDRDVDGSCIRRYCILNLRFTQISISNLSSNPLSSKPGTSLAEIEFSRNNTMIFRGNVGADPDGGYDPYGAAIVYCEVRRRIRDQPHPQHCPANNARQ
jgi:hypothetical protein